MSSETTCQARLLTQVDMPTSNIMDDAPIVLKHSRPSRSDAGSTATTNSTPSTNDTRKRSNSGNSSQRVKMTDWEKMDDYMRYLMDEHRWTMEDLIHAYASMIAEQSFKASTKTRTRKLAEAITREEVLLAMQELDSATAALETAIIPKFRSEMDGLTRNSEYFGKFDPTKRFPINEEEP
jgi:hypothetical protein